MNIQTKLLLPVLLCICQPVFSQWYTDFSDNLPDNGSKSSSMDVQVADLNGDGHLDIVLANEFQANTLLINDGTGHFTNSTLGNLPQEIHDSEDIAIADFDLDGDLDLVFCSEDDVTQGGSNVHEYYLNDGTGSFSASAFQFPDSKANAVIAADLNNDGAADLLWGNDGQNFILINDGSGQFLDETTTRLPVWNDTTQDLALADIDNDGDQDLLVGNEDSNRLYINDGNGFFTNETLTRLPQGVNMETRKVTFGDVDGDGDSDVYLSNVEFISGKNRQNRLYLNDGLGFFEDVTDVQLPAELTYTLDAIFVDIDSDDDLDILTTGISVSGGIGVHPIEAYLNNGNGVFTNETSLVLGPDNILVKGLGLIAAVFRSGNATPDIYVCDRKDAAANTKDVLLFHAMPVSIISKSIDSNLASLFPNPVVHTFSLKIDASLATPGRFLLHADDGRLLQEIKALRKNANEYHFDVQKIKPGNYWLKIEIGEQLITKRLQILGK